MYIEYKLQDLRLYDSTEPRGIGSGLVAGRSLWFTSGRVARIVTGMNREKGGTLNETTGRGNESGDIRDDGGICTSRWVQVHAGGRVKGSK